MRTSKSLFDKFEPIDVMIITAMLILGFLIIIGKDGIILGMMNTLIGALIRGFVKNDERIK